MLVLVLTMKRIFLALVPLLINSILPSQANNNPVQNPQTQYTQQSGYRAPRINTNGPGSVTGILNRIPRRFDRRTLMNSGPGLLQDAYYLFRRFGGNDQQQTSAPPQTQQDLPPQNAPEQVAQPSAPRLPVETGQVETQSIESTGPVAIENISEPEFQEIQPPQQSKQIMIPAPRPGYIIRYNQERGVYEEVREIKIEGISAPN